VILVSMSDSYFSAPVHQRGSWIDLVDDKWWKETLTLEELTLPSAPTQLESSEDGMKN